jgi:hypothetical protein
MLQKVVLSPASALNYSNKALEVRHRFGMNGSNDAVRFASEKSIDQMLAFEGI